MTFIQKDQVLNKAPSQYIYEVLICLFKCPIITHEPLDGFASELDRTPEMDLACFNDFKLRWLFQQRKNYSWVKTVFFFEGGRCPQLQRYKLSLINFYCSKYLMLIAYLLECSFHIPKADQTFLQIPGVRLYLMVSNI